MNSGQPTITRVLLVDDHPLIRRALRDILEQELDLEVVGEASNGLEAIQATNDTHPDVVIMDISMPVMSGVEATKQIKDANPLTLVLILTVHTDIETIFRILQAGASGYLIKSVFGPEVVHTIRALMDGDVVLAPGVSQEVLKYAFLHMKDLARPDRSESCERISPKGLEMLVSAAKGMSNKQIGAKLGISEATVKSYFVDIFQNLNVRSRTEAIFVCLKTGILTLEDIG